LVAAKPTPRQKDIHFVVDLVKVQTSSQFRFDSVKGRKEGCMGYNATKFWVVPRKKQFVPIGFWLIGIFI
jgi:hypothetical protein